MYSMKSNTKFNTPNDRAQLLATMADVEQLTDTQDGVTPSL